MPTDFFLSPDPRLPGQPGSSGDAGDADLVARHTLELARKSYNLSGQAYARRCFTEALSRCEQARFLLLESECKEPALELKILYSLGILYSATGNSSESVKHYMEAINLARESGDNERVGTIYMGIGNALLAQRDYPRSLVYSNRALEILVQLGLSNLVANVHHNIGAAYLGQGQLDQAAKFLQKALTAHGAAGEEIGTAHDLKELAKYHLKTGEADKALGEARESLETFTRHGHQREAGLAQILVGHIFETEARWDEAISSYDKAIGILENTPLVNELGAAYARLGYALARKGEGSQADRFFLRATDVFHTVCCSPVTQQMPV